MILKAAIYCRVSTQDQSLDHQIEACVSYCKRFEWDFEIFKEQISGAKSTRPQLDIMLQRIRQNEFKAVVVWKLDRLGRSTIHVIQLIEEFRNKNIKFIAVTQGINTEDAQGRFFLTILAAFGELEREYIKERTKKRLEYMRKQGKTLGRPKGSKDKKQRRKSGYYMRYAGGRK